MMKILSLDDNVKDTDQANEEDDEVGSDLDGGEQRNAASYVLNKRKKIILSETICKILTKSKIKNPNSIKVLRNCGK